MMIKIQPSLPHCPSGMPCHEIIIPGKVVIFLLHSAFLSQGQDLSLSLFIELSLDQV